MQTLDATSKSEKPQSATPNLKEEVKKPFFNSSAEPKIPFFGLNTIQPKLEIGQPNDKYEKEADAVADQVVMQPDVKEEERVQMQPSQKEDSYQMRTMAKEEEMLQKKPAIHSFGDGKKTASPDLAGRIDSAKGKGRPLEPRIQCEMGNKIGADFSSVKVHTGHSSIQMNQELRAKAFTVGNDIHFNQGQFSPGTAKGRHLLAHELTHVVQQGFRNNIHIDRQSESSSPQSSRPPENWREQLPNLLRDASSFAHNAAERYATQVWRAAEAFEEYAGSEVERLSRQITGADLVRTLFAVFPTKLPHFIAGRIKSNFFRELSTNTAGYAYAALTSATEEAIVLGSDKKDLEKAIKILPERTKNLASTLPVFVSKKIDDKIEAIVNTPSSRWRAEDAMFVRPFVNAMIESPAGVTANQLHAIIESQIGLPTPSNAIDFQISLYRKWVEAFARKRIIAESSTYWKIRDITGTERIFDRMARAEGEARAEERRRHLNRLTPK